MYKNTGGSFFMAKLDCNVTSCMHNADDCCCKAEIQVDGSCAKECCETCCGSYDKKGEHSYSNNASKTPDKVTEVNCKATNCVYNADGYCDADHIGIVGSSAVSSEQTECGSFRSR